MTWIKVERAGAPQGFRVHSCKPTRARSNVITHRPRRRQPPHLVELVPPPSSEPGPLAALRQHATAVRARRRQQLAFSTDKVENVYVVRSGLLVLHANGARQHEQILSLHYPGDIWRAGLAPPLPGMGLRAAWPSEVWRLPTERFETLIAADSVLALPLNLQLAEQHARTLLHVAAVGGLNGEERVVSFLIELGLRIGTGARDRLSFEMPLSRTDIAAYLALNADTLSRIVSRLKAKGLLAQTGRTRALLPDWEGLCALSPVASTVVALHAKRGNALKSPPARLHAT